MMTTILELLKIREQINKIRFIQQLTFVGCFVVEPFKGDALIQLTYSMLISALPHSIDEISHTFAYYTVLSLSLFK